MRPEKWITSLVVIILLISGIAFFFAYQTQRQQRLERNRHQLSQLLQLQQQQLRQMGLQWRRFVLMLSKTQAVTRYADALANQRLSFQPSLKNGYCEGV